MARLESLRTAHAKTVNKGSEQEEGKGDNNPHFYSPIPVTKAGNSFDHTKRCTKRVHIVPFVVFTKSLAMCFYTYYSTT